MYTNSIIRFPYQDIPIQAAYLTEALWNAFPVCICTCMYIRDEPFRSAPFRSVPEARADRFVVCLFASFSLRFSEFLFLFIFALALCLHFTQQFLFISSCYGFYFYMFRVPTVFALFVLVKGKAVVELLQIVYGSRGWLQMLLQLEPQPEGQ